MSRVQGGNLPCGVHKGGIGQEKSLDTRSTGTTKVEESAGGVVQGLDARSEG